MNMFAKMVALAAASAVALAHPLAEQPEPPKLAPPLPRSHKPSGAAAAKRASRRRRNIAKRRRSA